MPRCRSTQNRSITSENCKLLHFDALPAVVLGILSSTITIVGLNLPEQKIRPDVRDTLFLRELNSLATGHATTGNAGPLGLNMLDSNDHLAGMIEIPAELGTQITGSLVA